MIKYKYYKVEEFLNRLSRAELLTYNYLRSIKNANNNPEVYASLSTICLHTGYKNKRFISESINKLIEKGLIAFKELVLSDYSRWKCFKYYINEPDQSMFFHGLDDSEKGILKVKDVPLDEQQQELYNFIKFDCNVQDFTRNKLMTLINAAIANEDIDNEHILDTIKLIAKYCIKYSKETIKNKFGYFKKAIINYRLFGVAKPSAILPKSTRVELSEEEQSEILSIHESSKVQGFGFSENHVAALFCNAKKKGKNLRDVLAKIKSSVNISKINDMFKYANKCIFNDNPKPDKKPVTSGLSFDIEDFEKLAITYSGNTKTNDTNKIRKIESSDLPGMSFSSEDIEKLSVSNRVIIAPGEEIKEQDQEQIKVNNELDENIKIDAEFLKAQIREFCHPTTIRESEPEIDDTEQKREELLRRLYEYECNNS